jgi:hypothetical protein
MSNDGEDALIWFFAILGIIGVCIWLSSSEPKAATLVESYNPHQCTVKIDHYKPGVGGKLVVTCTCPNPVVTLSPPVSGSQTLTVSCPKEKK